MVGASPGKGEAFKRSLAMDKVPAVLACEAGNTTTKLACIDGEKSRGLRRLKLGGPTSLPRAISDLWAQMPGPKTMVASSVSPAALETLEAAARQSIEQEVLVVGRDLPLPIETALDHPESVGTDRLCCAAAAFDRLGVACVVADFGTAVTIDCVSAEGVFMGGAIMPGLAMAAEALSTKTAQLPRVDLTAPDWVFGRNTREAIIGGLVGQARGALREFVESYATALGQWPIVIATGGDAELICSQAGRLDLVQAIVEDLSLRGAAMAYYRSLLK